MTTSSGRSNRTKGAERLGAKTVAAEPQAAEPRLTRREGLALWRQVMEHVSGEIAKGVFGPGVRLPTEQALSKQFGVNRHTVRRAMEELEKRDLVAIRQGSGSYVAEELIDFNLNRYVSFSGVIMQMGRRPSLEILRVKEEAAEQSIANRLGVGRARKIIIVERLLFMDNSPLILFTHYFPASRFGKIVGLLRHNPSICAAFAALGIEEIRLSVSRITARLPFAAEAEHLQQRRNRPLLTTESVFTDHRGEVVEFAIAAFAPGRTRLVVE